MFNFASDVRSQSRLIRALTDAVAHYRGNEEHALDWWEPHSILGQAIEREPSLGPLLDVTYTYTVLSNGVRLVRASTNARITHPYDIMNPSACSAYLFRQLVRGYESAFFGIEDLRKIFLYRLAFMDSIKDTTLTIQPLMHFNDKASERQTFNNLYPLVQALLSDTKIRLSFLSEVE
jgi:hypothetical protein